MPKDKPEPRVDDKDHGLAGLDLPSVYVSKFNIAVLDNVARVVFGEQIVSDGPVHYHSAFIVTHADLHNLARMIDRLLETARENKAKYLREQHGQVMN